MPLQFSADRVLTVLVTAATTSDDPSARRPWPAEARPSARTPIDVMPADNTLLDGPRRAELEQLLREALVGDAAGLRDVFTSDATGWAPTWSFRSRREAEELREEHAASLAVDAFVVDRIWFPDPVVVAEWHLTAIHNAPLLVGGDVLVEATGRRVTLAGASIALVVGDRIASLHTYFDDASLVEQVLDGPQPLGS